MVTDSRGLKQPLVDVFNKAISGQKGLKVKMTDSKRHRGFVIGSDTTSKQREIWKVRVKDPTSPHDGEKLVVASVRGGLELARGLNVHFVIGTMDDPSGAKVL